MNVSKRVLIAALAFSAVLIITNIVDFGVTGFAKEFDKKLGKESSTKNTAHNFPGSAFEYAQMVEPILGVLPKVDLAAGVEIPLYVNGVPGHGLLGDDYPHKAEFNITAKPSYKDSDKNEGADFFEKMSKDDLIEAMKDKGMTDDEIAEFMGMLKEGKS